MQGEQRWRAALIPQPVKSDELPSNVNGNPLLWAATLDVYLHLGVTGYRKVNDLGLL
jgi:hypothetical protein